MYSKLFAAGKIWVENIDGSPEVIWEDEKLEQYYARTIYGDDFVTNMKAHNQYIKRWKSLHPNNPKIDTSSLPRRRTRAPNHK